MDPNDTSNGGETVTGQNPSGAPEGMPPEAETPEGAETETPEEPVAAAPEPEEPDEATLAKSPAVQRMLKRAADKAVRDAAQKDAENKAKAAKRAKMDAEQRAAAERADIEAERDTARSEAASARVELDFYRGLTGAKLTPVDEDAAEFIKQAAVKIAEDDGIEMRHAIREVAKRKPYLFDTAAPAPAENGDAETESKPRVAAAPKPRPTTAPAPRRDGATPPETTTPKVDARSMDGPAFQKHLQEKYGLPGVP